MAAAMPGNDHDIETPHCPICFSEFKSPRQLPCLHSFCQGCLQEYVSSKATNDEELKEFQCPICRSMIDILGKGKTSETLYTCDCCVFDGISATAQGFCIVCKEAMYETCLSVHKRQKVSKDHSIVTIESRTKNRKNIINFQKGFRCREHEEKTLKFYCRDHQIACCSSCCIVHHRQCGNVSDIAKDCTALLEELKPVRVLEEMKKLENHLINFEKKIDSFIAKLESQIRKKINGLLDDLERKVKLEGNERSRTEVIRKQNERRECRALLNAVRNSHMSLETVMKNAVTRRYILFIKYFLFLFIIYLFIFYLYLLNIFHKEKCIVS
ncbi:hypothetical protein ACJMK2_014706 [Sinanodonta woodiana]|uniref:Uncharacterized protein n=1 Tax=Sinanodonta woodiana TaxID=1069815 RepID=A0ABD3V490_SINWO